MRGRHHSSRGAIPQRCLAYALGLGARWHAWREAFRENPRVIWRSPAVRLGGLALLAIVIIMGVQTLIGALAPRSGVGGGGRYLQEATLYVACTNAACRASYTTQQALDFKGWPLKCQKCGGASVYRASRCGVCRHWFASAPGAAHACPFCAEKAAEENAKRRDPNRSGRSTDPEDPW